MFQKCKFTAWSLLFGLSSAVFCAAQEGGDLQAQILYAFHGEDSNQLGGLIQSLRSRLQTQAPDAALRYHLAHADYRMGELGELGELGERGDGGRTTQAAAALGECIDQLDRVLRRQLDSVEAMALQSACYLELARFRKFEAPLLRSRAERRLRSAFALEPRNPRVVFLSAMQEFSHAGADSAESRLAFAQLQLAAQLFEQTSATRADVPGWGHSEAYLELGVRLQTHGDRLGARNWIEKSLLVAPGYKAAQRQLARLVRD